MCDKCALDVSHTHPMPHTAVLVKIWSERLEDEVGVWCPYCQLPSAIRVKVAYGFEGTLTGNVVKVTRCLDCPLEVIERVDLIDNRRD